MFFMQRICTCFFLSKEPVHIFFYSRNLQATCTCFFIQGTCTCFFYARNLCMLFYSRNLYMFFFIQGTCIKTSFHSGDSSILKEFICFAYFQNLWDISQYTEAYHGWSLSSKTVLHVTYKIELNFMFLMPVNGPYPERND